MPAPSASKGGQRLDNIGDGGEDDAGDDGAAANDSIKKGLRLRNDERARLHQAHLQKHDQKLQGST